MSAGGEWIKHDAGPCPVNPDTEVNAKFEDGRFFDLYPFPARFLNWRGIIAYRVVKP